MYKRKIYSKLEEWYEFPKHKPLVIKKGGGQCEKTTSVRQFTEQKLKEVVYLDFREHPEYKRFFMPNLDVTQIIMSCIKK